MEISYRREIKHNYLVITPDSGTTPGYEARMLAGNEIQGLLRMHIRYQDGSSLYYYDITSRQPLSRLLDARFISRDEICQILIQIHVALMRMEEYLLGDGGILLDPGLIYMDPELFQTVPGSGTDRGISGTVEPFFAVYTKVCESQGQGMRGPGIWGISGKPEGKLRPG